MSLFLSSASVLFNSLTLNARFTIWCSAQTALFLSFLAKTALAYLPTVLSLPLRPPFSFQQTQYAQVFPLKPAAFCEIFAGLGSTNKSATSHFFSSQLTLALSSSPPFLLPQSLWHELSSLSSCFIRLQWVHGHTFLPGNNAAELDGRGALLVLSVIRCSFSPLISRIHSSLFSDWKRTVSSKFFDTQVPLFSTEELVLPRHARCVPSRLRCKEHSQLLSSY